MAEKWKPLEPTLPGLQEGGNLQVQVERALADDGDVRAMVFVDEAVAGLEGRTLDFSGCRFERCAFGEMDVERLSFVDCVFDKCELSNMRREGLIDFRKNNFTIIKK